MFSESFSGSARFSKRISKLLAVEMSHLRCIVLGYHSEAKSLKRPAQTLCETLISVKELLSQKF